MATAKIPAQNWARLSSDAEVLEVFVNPKPDWVSEYNRTNDSRLRACPSEVKVGWVRKNGIFFAPSAGV